ncbi:Nuclear distribution protein nudE-like 1 [Amphibalanus amphitrite]|uniref:Nuclear distribution protein nudE-like 1 n=1 Tax=Amphibalanus amphitrite TaxID=1232801 RepID=A0A6A4UZY4_AMPAM|nr:Nuclear distribution protein nudE-like 1 [Amphibalanus amphitrite]
MEKLEHLQVEAHHEISDLQTGLSEVTSIKDKLSKYIRELEQENDDLERVKRTMVVSLEDFEGRLNQALERNAFLESELDEKETLREMVQRLKDESRDLRQELVIRERHEADDQEPDNERSAVDSNKRLEDGPDGGVRPVAPPVATTATPAALTASTTAKVPPAVGEQPATNGHVVAPLDGGPMTPSSRISALNIVGDLLRKVGALESKLASCKSYVKDNPRPHAGHGQQVGRDLHRLRSLGSEFRFS